MVRADHAVKTLASTGEQLSREVAVQHSIRRIRGKEHIVPLEEIEEEGSRRKRKKATRVTLLMYTLMMIPCLYIFVLHIIHIGCEHHCISIGLTTNTVFCINIKHSGHDSCLHTLLSRKKASTSGVIDIRS